MESMHEADAIRSRNSGGHIPQNQVRSAPRLSVQLAAKGWIVVRCRNRFSITGLAARKKINVDGAAKASEC